MSMKSRPPEKPKPADEESAAWAKYCAAAKGGKYGPDTEVLLLQWGGASVRRCREEAARAFSAEAEAAAAKSYVRMLMAAMSRMEADARAELAESGGAPSSLANQVIAFAELASGKVPGVI